MSKTIKDHVQGYSKFQFYRKGELHYRTVDTKFDFVVPLEDCGDGTFLDEDKSMFMMRYIRKQMEANAEGQAA